jgi:hypothetical protein
LVVTYALTVAMACGHFGTGVTEMLVILQGLLDSVRRLTLAFQVIWVVFLLDVNFDLYKLLGLETYLPRPAFVVASRFTLKISSLLIVENPTKAIGHTRWNVGDSLQWTVLRDSIDNVLTRGSSQGFLVGFAYSLDGCIFDMLVARNASRVVRPFVVITGKASSVETIDDISALKILLPKMRSTVSNFFIFTERIKWPVRQVSGISLSQRATA